MSLFDELAREVEQDTAPVPRRHELGNHQPKRKREFNAAWNEVVKLWWFKIPDDETVTSYCLQRFSGLTQECIAGQLDVSQKTISEWTREVKDWCEAGNPLPDVDTIDLKIQSLDPAVIELGAQIENRTPRQRKRRSGD